MIGKLRRNFIIATMISVVFVLAVIIAVINIASFITSDQEASALLALLADNGGSFGRDINDNEPMQMPDMNWQFSDNNSEPPEKPANDPEIKQDKKFGFRDNGMRDNMFTAETPYETRFFTVVLKEDGSVSSVNTGRIAAVSTDEALEMAKSVSASGKESAYYGEYKYLAAETDGGTMYIFVDRSRALKSIRDFLTISLLVALCAAVAILIMVFFFSGIVIRPIAESYEKQKKFITNAGHELKTPLAVINSCTEVIELEQGESKWTDGISAQTKRLAELTNELVALARMDEGGAQLTSEEFSLSEAFSEILDPFGLMAESKGLGFTADIQPDIIYKGDRSAISKLCSIMADNAVKYCTAGGNITFTLVKKNRRIVFSSENTADGTEKGAHPELFDRFHRGDTSHSGDIPGYGIGLSMAQSIVTAHGGKIEAFSKDGKSLTITVKL